LDWITDTWDDLSSWFTDNVWDPIGDWVGDTLEDIKKKFEDGKKWVTDTWNTVSNWFDKNVWTPIYNTAVPIINFVVGIFAFAWDGIKKIWS
ncbi:hypothetical protein, partial [Bacillus sp. EKM417B]